MTWDQDDRVDAALGVVVVVVIVAVLCLAGIIITHHQTETYDLWDAQCPFGHYYTDVDGDFIFFHLDSSLGEAYTLKYLVDGYGTYGELKTLIVPSNSPRVHVHFTGANEMDSMWMTITWRGFADYPTWTADDCNVEDVHIYVPDPKLFGGG